MATKKVFVALDQDKADQVQKLLGLASTDEAVDAALDRVLDGRLQPSGSPPSPSGSPPSPESWWDPPPVLDTQDAALPNAANPEAVTREPAGLAPPGRITSSELRAVRFREKLRGYDPKSVDSVIEGISTDLDHGLVPTEWLDDTDFPKSVRGYHPEDVDALFARVRTYFPR